MCLLGALQFAISTILKQSLFLILYMLQIDLSANEKIYLFLFNSAPLEYLIMVVSITPVSPVKQSDVQVYPSRIMVATITALFSTAVNHRIVEWSP